MREVSSGLVSEKCLCPEKTGYAKAAKTRRARVLMPRPYLVSMEGDPEEVSVQQIKRTM
jgi:hypothetical protein